MLRLEDLHVDAIRQFELWFHEAQDQVPFDWYEPNVMALATSDLDGRVTCRMMLLKGVSCDGFLFFTNYRSLKGHQLSENARAAITFYWPFQGRQVRVEGTVTMVSRQESEAYFHTRPRGAQLGAVVSPQSQVVAGREALDQAVDQLDQQLEGEEVPLPEHWGGYRLTPERIEFWQSGVDRLHDRFLYTRHEDRWQIVRLAP